jgi:hypothetical protein
MKAKVLLRRDFGLTLKPESEQIDGNVYEFRKGWLIEDDDSRYPGETAYIAHDPSYPDDAPVWIASGDLEEVT